MTELTFKINNLTCDACIKVSTKTLRKLPGVTEATIDLSTGTGHIVSNEPLTQSDVVAALKDKGYDVAFSSSSI